MVTVWREVFRVVILGHLTRLLGGPGSGLRASLRAGKPSRGPREL